MLNGGLKCAVAVVAVCALAFTAEAAAAPTVDGEFAIPGGVGSNNEIVQGPDGNMWVTRQNVNGVARITPGGTVTPFPTSNTAVGITVGPDNNLWVTTVIGVAKINPATGAEVDTYDVGLPAGGFGITTGPDNNLWAVGDGELVRFSPADPEGTDKSTAIAGLSAKGMTTGSDGLLWIADGSGRILSATATNTPTVTPFVVDGGPQDVAAGLNGQVAFANPLSSPHEVGLISAGVAQEIPIDTSDPFGVAFGNDGAYWIARSSTDDLLRLTPDGQTSFLTGFSDSGNVGPRKVATGPEQHPLGHPRHPGEGRPGDRCRAADHPPPRPSRRRLRPAGRPRPGSTARRRTR